MKVGIAIVILILAAGGIYLLNRPDQSQIISPPSPELSSPPSASPSPSRLHTREITGSTRAFDFSFEIPTEWQAEAIKAIEAINIYDPHSEGASTLEKSQILIRYFRASDFLTLSTVSIFSREKKTVIGRPAVDYLIEKKSAAADFPHQPAWRNRRHRVLDIRASDSNPSVFYVFGKRPELTDEEFEKFLNSIKLGGKQAALFYPIKNFPEGIIKKPFGIFITPQTSPVQPERFSGYHTGADVEADTADHRAEIPIYSIADGRVLESTRAAGYGGVLAIEHRIGGERVIGIYGHLDPVGLASLNRAVRAGERIGFLGKADTPETDFNRKHLHFGLYTGKGAVLLGYVDRKEELKEWIDPVDFLRQYTVARP